MTANENCHPAVQPRRIRFNYPVAALDRLIRILRWLETYGGLPMDDTSAEGYPG